MGWRGTLALVAIVLVAGGYLWVAGPTGPERPQDEPNLLGEPRLRDPSKFVPLLAFQPADVAEVHIHYRDRDLILQRQGDKWIGSENPASTESFLTTIGELGRIMEIPESEATLHDYGLDDPADYIELILTGQTSPLLLQIGRQNPAATGVYVRINRQGPVVLAGALVTWELDKMWRRDPRP